jgi:hypothetical protein
MSQVDDFIRAAREAGKSDALIRQELASSGWQEADITNALNSYVAPVTTGTAPAVTTGVAASTPVVATGIMAKLFMALAAFVLIGGGIGVYEFMKHVPSQSDVDTLVQEAVKKEEGETPPPQKEKFPFECSDLFTEQDFQKFAYPDRPMVIDGNTEVDVLNVADCEFSQRSLNSNEMRVRMFTATINAAGLPGHPSVEEKYQELRQKPPGAMDNESDIKKAGDISGVGSKAYRNYSGSIIVVSSNKKYLFTAWDIAGIELCPQTCTQEQIEQNLIEAAKIVDTNISKF